MVFFFFFFLEIRSNYLYKYLDFSIGTGNVRLSNANIWEELHSIVFHFMK